MCVVLAATVYVWISGSGAGASAPAKAAAISALGSIEDPVDPTSGAAVAANASDKQRNYTVTGATPGMRWSDVSVLLDGAPLPCNDDLTGTADAYRVNTFGGFVGGWANCSDAAGVGPNVLLRGGDIIQVYDNGGGLAGKTLSIFDRGANTLLVVMPIG